MKKKKNEKEEEGEKVKWQIHEREAMVMMMTEGRRIENGAEVPAEVHHHHQVVNLILQTLRKSRMKKLKR